MTPAWQPWQRLLPVWLPAVALFVISGSFYAWQTSDSVGRAAQIRSTSFEAPEVLRIIYDYLSRPNYSEY